MSPTPPISDEALAAIRAVLATDWDGLGIGCDVLRAVLSRLEAAEALMLDLRAYIVMHDDISMHSKAVALSDRVTNHFPDANPKIPPVGSGT